MNIKSKPVARVRRAPDYLAAAVLAGCATGALAQDAGSNVDSVDYFLREGPQTKEHPFITSQDSSTHGGESQLRIWEGPRDSVLKGTFKGDVAYYPQSNSWFGASEANLGAKSDDWWESGINAGIEGSYFFENFGEMYGRVAFVYSSTDDVDAAGSDLPNDEDPSYSSMENYYLGWRSGDTFGLGKDFLDISVGMQPYQAGTGFILYDMGSDGGGRGGYWIGERKAADFAALAKFTYQSLKVDVIYTEANDNPKTNTDISGVTIDYDLDELGSVGGGYYYVESDIDTRDGMDVYDIRFAATPFAAFDTADWLNPIRFEGEYVDQDNDDLLDASGWFLSAGYDWNNVRWTPGVTYRYAAFEGDDPDTAKSENFDPLYYGFYDWGTWFQGEILGEYVLLNSNLNTHMVRVNVRPTKDISVNLFYYHFELDDAEGFGVSSDTFADEWNLMVDWTVNDSFAVSLVGGYATPDDGAKEYTGGDDDWAYGMMLFTYAFK
jgi:hypothetical protein